MALTKSFLTQCKTAVMRHLQAAIQILLTRLVAVAALTCQSTVHNTWTVTLQRSCTAERCPQVHLENAWLGVFVWLQLLKQAQLVGDLW